MKGTERRGHEMLVHVEDYISARPADFPPESMGGILLISLREVIAIIEEQAREQNSGINIREEGTQLRSIAREDLRQQLEAICRTAVSMAMAGTTPGLENRFRMPRGENDQALINAARVAAQDAAPIAANFISFGLPQTFIADLNAAIVRFEQAVERQNTGRDTHVAATTAIDEALERGINIVRQLDAIVRNKYADDPAQLAAWQSASHIERSPQRTQTQTTPPTTPPAP
jgi:hypothetical protein